MQASASDVFISYKAEERKRLIPLVEAFEAEGFSVWWDQHIGGGTNWRDEIEAHLNAAKVVIVVWSKRSTGPEGRFVRDEAAQAQEAGQYLPITIDNVRPPLGFREVQALDLSSWWGKREDPRFKILCETIRHRLEGKEIPRNLVVPKGARIDRRTAIVGGTGVAALAAAGGGWLLLKPTAANAKRIAVMDFDNLSGDPGQAYFAEGIAEELRSSLSRVGMEVIGKASCDAVKNLDTKTAASKLEVANILTGSVRRSPATLRVETQLVSGSDGVEHWQQSYDRAPGDEIKIQTDIAENVASALSIALGQRGRAALTLGGTGDSGAQDLVLQARNLLRQSTSADTFGKILALADAAIARDPNYADAYVLKASALSDLAGNYAPTPAEVANQFAQAGAAAQRAVALAPRLGSAHMALANIAHGRLDFPSALRETEKAVALSANDPDVLAYAARSLAWFGSVAEGSQLADRAIVLDPLNARFFYVKCEALTLARRYAEAIDLGRKALALAPERRNTHIYVGDAFLLLGQPARAKAEYEAIGAGNPFKLARLALLAARTGDRSGAERMTAQLRQQMGATDSYQYGEIYAQLGDRERAFTEFENAIRAKDAGLVYLKNDPFLDPIRGDPRYAALLRRLNFP